MNNVVSFPIPKVPRARKRTKVELYLRARATDELRAELIRLNKIFPDYVVGYMLEHNLPLTREVYIGLNWGSVKEWTAEHEGDMPEPFHKEMWPKTP